MNLPTCEHCRRSPARMRENGCIADSPIPGRWQVGGYTFQRCPRKEVTRQSGEFIKAYNWKEQGFLPNPGGWLEQPAKFIEAMEMIAHQDAEMQKEAIEKTKMRK